jgi:hypothetical protein
MEARKPLKGYDAEEAFTLVAEAARLLGTAHGDSQARALWRLLDAAGLLARSMKAQWPLEQLPRQVRGETTGLGYGLLVTRAE